MEFKKLVTSEVTLIVLACLAGIFVLLGVFRLGVVVGHRQANFACQWSDNYTRIFGPPQALPMMHDFMRDGFMHGGGIMGSIIKIDGQNLVIKGEDGAEKSVLIDDKTILRQAQDDIKASDLKVDDKVTVIGQPDSQGQIDAKLIRVFENPPVQATSTQTK